MITWTCTRCGDHRHAPCGKPLCGLGDDNLTESINTHRRSRGELAASRTTGEKY